MGKITRTHKGIKLRKSAGDEILNLLELKELLGILETLSVCKERIAINVNYTNPIHINGITIRIIYNY